MNISLIYNKDLKKVMIKIDSNEEKELSFEEILLITNNVIDQQLSLKITTEGFDDNPDVEENYKNIFKEIDELKNDSEIIALKEEYDGLDKKND